MIVYNVQRRWFTEKAEAEAYRKQQGLKPADTIKIAVGTREELASLLNALCDPRNVILPPVTQKLVDTAFVMPAVSVPDCVPRFLLNKEQQKEWDEVHLAEEA